MNKKMKIIEDNENKNNIQLNQSVACIGTFDGMHMGHQELLKHAYKIGKGDYTVVTFKEMPQRILEDKNYKYMINNSDKEKLLIELDASNLIYFNFERIKDMKPKKFCAILNEKYGIKHVVVGEDFRFGKDRTGDINFLKEYFSNENVTIVPNKLVNGYKVSSTSIRDFLMKGDIHFVNSLLGRPYSFTSEVIHGSGTGSKIGFPTANLKQDKYYRLPKNGVYAVRIGIEGLSTERLGMMNIGYRPTIKSDTPSLHLEVNIFNFDSNIYGNDLTIKFISYLREEMNFNNLNDLSIQLSKDKEEAINKLNS